VSVVWAFPLLQTTSHSFPVIDSQESTANEDFIVVFVDFQNKKSSTEFADIQKIFSSQEPGFPSVYNYYKESSEGKFLPRFHFIDGWYTSEQDMEYYGNDAKKSKSNCGTETIDSANTCTAELVKEILELLSIVWLAKIVAIGVFAYFFIKHFKLFMIAGAVMLITFLFFSVLSVALPMF